jgi:2-polyprenyl-3-methyl-5-hydroxy-6-metoxy-1,4-benzoquinol methylase
MTHLELHTNSTPRRTIRRRIAGWLASSTVFRYGERLFEANRRDWHFPLSKMGKLAAGAYIILRDYSEGRFPPVFADQARAYRAEIDYLQSLPGLNVNDAQEGNLRKPFWGSANVRKYCSSFVRLLQTFERLGLKPQSRLLELGCGTGWMAEFLATSDYQVVGTSIAPMEIEVARRRVDALRAKGLNGSLNFAVSPMESVDEVVAGEFDCVFVFEALHHAFDWKRAVRAAYRRLRPGGWLVLANEPNVFHTFIAYRVARLSNTHEIGFRRRDLVRELTSAHFQRIRVLAPRFNNLVSPHWIAAMKSPV